MTNLEKKEIEKCKNDFEYFCEKYVKIEIYQNNEFQKIPLKLYPAQSSIFKSVNFFNKVIVEKDRRLFGISTFNSAYVLWKFLFFDKQHIMITYPSTESSRTFMDRIYFMYNHIPDFLLKSSKDIMIKNKNKFILNNGNKINSRNASVDAFISEQPTLIILEDSIYYHDLEQIYTSIAPLIVRDTKILIVGDIDGTTSKSKNTFDYIFSNATLGENGFIPIILK